MCTEYSNHTRDMYWQTYKTHKGPMINLISTHTFPCNLRLVLVEHNLNSDQEIYFCQATIYLMPPKLPGLWIWKQNIWCLTTISPLEAYWMMSTLRCNRHKRFTSQPLKKLYLLVSLNQSILQQRSPIICNIDSLHLCWPCTPMT